MSTTRKGYIPNEVRLSGILEGKYTDSRGNIWLAVYTNGTTVTAIAFNKTAKFAEKLNVGDVVVLEATLQKSKGGNEASGKHPRTIAINHIAEGNDETPAVNSFSLFGRATTIENDPATGEVTSILKVVSNNGTENLIKVNFDCNTDELRLHNFINARGSFLTDAFGRTKCVVKRWKNVKPR